MNEKLTNCPFCGGEVATMNFKPGRPDGYWQANCKKCGTKTKYYQTEDEAIAAWNTRAADENPPLTYEELQNMENEPVWLIPKCGEPYWDIVRTDCGYEYPIVYFQNTRFGAYQKNGYGKTWLAYRRKPEDVN